MLESPRASDWPIKPEARAAVSHHHAAVMIWLFGFCSWVMVNMVWCEYALGLGTRLKNSAGICMRNRTTPTHTDTHFYEGSEMHAEIVLYAIITQKHFALLCQILRINLRIYKCMDLCRICILIYSQTHTHTSSMRWRTSSHKCAMKVITNKIPCQTSKRKYVCRSLAHTDTDTVSHICSFECAHKDHIGTSADVHCKTDHRIGSYTHRACIN